MARRTRRSPRQRVVLLSYLQGDTRPQTAVIAAPATDIAGAPHESPHIGHQTVTDLAGIFAVSRQLLVEQFLLIRDANDEHDDHWDENG
jgi:hypothetical protein